MIRRPPRSTRTDTLFPYTTLFRAELGAEKARRDVAVAVLDHAHHHQARDDEVHVLEPVHLAHARADQAAEAAEIQGHGDRGRPQGLAPDEQDAARQSVV